MLKTIYLAKSPIGAEFTAACKTATLLFTKNITSIPVPLLRSQSILTEANFEYICCRYESVRTNIPRQIMGFSDFPLVSLLFYRLRKHSCIGKSESICKHVSSGAHITC